MWFVKNSRLPVRLKCPFVEIIIHNFVLEDHPTKRENKNNLPIVSRDHKRALGFRRWVLWVLQLMSGNAGVDHNTDMLLNY